MLYYFYKYTLFVSLKRIQYSITNYTSARRIRYKTTKPHRVLAFSLQRTINIMLNIDATTPPYRLIGQ